MSSRWMSFASTPSFSDSSLMVTPSDRKIGPVGIGFLNSSSLPESCARVDFAARRRADLETGFASATTSASSAPSPFSISGRVMSEYVSSSYAPTNSRKSTSSATVIFGFAPRFAAGFFVSFSSSFLRFAGARSGSGGGGAVRPSPTPGPGRPAGPVGRSGAPAGRIPGPPGVGRYTEGAALPEGLPEAGPMGRDGPVGRMAGAPAPARAIAGAPGGPSGLPAAGRGGGSTILRGRAGLAGSSGSGSDGTTAVRAGSAGFARASAAAGGGVETVAGPGRRTTGSTSGSRRAGAVFSTILMRESALFWGRNAFD